MCIIYSSHKWPFFVLSFSLFILEDVIEQIHLTKQYNMICFEDGIRQQEVE